MSCKRSERIRNLPKSNTRQEDQSEVDRQADAETVSFEFLVFLPVRLVLFSLALLMIDR